jgi:hypothetical protein
VYAAGYVETAVAVHRSYLDGKLAPEIQSGSPAFVTAWFAGKVPFDFRLPADRGGNPLYRLSGARLVSYGGHNAALGHLRHANRKDQSSGGVRKECHNSRRR